MLAVMIGGPLDGQEAEVGNMRYGERMVARPHPGASAFPVYEFIDAAGFGPRLVMVGYHEEDPYLDKSARKNKDR